MTSIFIVDDHPLVREWLANLLKIESDLAVIGEADDTTTALAAMLANPPDIAVVDLTLKRGSGLDLIRDLRERLPNVQVVVLTMHEELTDLERAFRAGASAYVTKRESPRLIVDAIRTVLTGKVFANPDALAHLASRFARRPNATEQSSLGILSDRELDVFRRLGEGRSTKEISDALGVSLKTVQTYCSRIKEKLGFKDWQELSRAAYLRNSREARIDQPSQ